MRQNIVPSVMAHCISLGRMIVCYVEKIGRLSLSGGGNAGLWR